MYIVRKFLLLLPYPAIMFMAWETTLQTKPCQEPQALLVHSLVAYPPACQGSRDMIDYVCAWVDQLLHLYAQNIATSDPTENRRYPVGV